MITTDDIRKLCDEAGAAGDLKQVAMCKLALGGGAREAEEQGHAWASPLRALLDRGMTTEDAWAELAIGALSKRFGVELWIDSGGEPPFQYAVWCDGDDAEIAGAGETPSEAIEAAREQLLAWEVAS